MTTRPRSLRPVAEATPGPLDFDTANALFQEHWAASRDHCADALAALGSLATPLYKSTPAGRHRVDAAIYAADRALKATQALAASLAEAREVVAREEAGRR